MATAAEAALRQSKHCGLLRMPLQTFVFARLMCCANATRHIDCLVGGSSDVSMLVCLTNQLGVNCGHGQTSRWFSTCFARCRTRGVLQQGPRRTSLSTVFHRSSCIYMRFIGNTRLRPEPCKVKSLTWHSIHITVILAPGRCITQPRFAVGKTCRASAPSRRSCIRMCGCLVRLAHAATLQGVPV